MSSPTRMASAKVSPTRENYTVEKASSFKIKEDISSSPELKLSEQKALLELRTKLEDAILGNTLFESLKENDADLDESLEGISLWGVPLLPSKGHEETDAILVKFLMATEFKASNAFEMLRKTLKWRMDFRVEGILEEDLGSDLSGVSYINSTDKEGRPLVYNNFGAFKDKGLYQRTFGTEERREAFLRWRIQFMEKGVQKLSFKKGGVGSIVQIIDMKNSPGHAMKEMHTVVKKALALLQNNYPDVVLRNIFVNVPFKCYVHRATFSGFLTQTTNSKCIFVRPQKVAETLLKYIAPENIPVQYGGLKRENDDEFSPENGKVTETTLRAGGRHTIEIPVNEAGVTVVWDMAVVGWEVTYKEEFIPDDEGSYKILIQNEKRMEATVRNSFYINEPGKVVLTVDSRSFKKKKLLYRSKTKPTIPLYNLFKR